MPRKKNHQQQQQQQQQQQLIEDFPDPIDHTPVSLEEEEPEQPRASRKKNRNAPTRLQRHDSSSPELPLDEPIATEPTFSPVQSQSLLNQLSFPTHIKSKPVDIREEIVSSEKVSDQYTPPSDGGISEELYGKSPNTESVVVSSAANTPPREPGFSTRRSFKTRSPPISPAQRNARPVSFGGSISPLPGYPRYPQSNYGSPPAPHLPQAHFYAANDIDLGLPHLQQYATNESVIFTKAVKLSSLHLGRARGILSGCDGTLSLCSFSGESIVQIGSLVNLPGSVIDAQLLQWTTGDDPFLDLRPLVAVNLLSSGLAEHGRPQSKMTIAVYSLSRQRHVANLLHAPVQPSQHASVMPTPDVRNDLRLSSNSNFLAVSNGKSGEIFVFSPAQADTTAAFECIGKFWTSIQPLEQRRDSSHHRPRQAETYAPKSRRVVTSDNVPIMSFSGRWLATCPPETPSLNSAGMVVGEHIIVSRQAGLEALSAPSRPVANCDVDSPDADTLLGKVARGVAQEVVKGARWLGDQGMQAWQSYWKKDEASAAVLNPACSNVPYQAHNQYGQFPPTHAEVKPAAKSPEMVSVYDLKALRDSSITKSSSLAPSVTFQPPHGCSFLSFAPHGLMLLTASRKGDYQYVWNLLEMKHGRLSAAEAEGGNSRGTPIIRQLARFDRMSESVVVDVVWETPSLARFALLTKNKTVHVFDLPVYAMSWPPPRRAKKSRSISAPPDGPPGDDPDSAPAGGFLASAMNFAGRTQPMLANLRGRAPGTGLAGISTAGFGLVAATGARGSKAVATGLSKSLGAATETVGRIHYAGQSRLPVKAEGDVGPGCIFWTHRASKAGLCVVDKTGVRCYQVRKSKNGDARQRETTVFEAGNAASFNLPLSVMLHSATATQEVQGFWQANPAPSGNTNTEHPLSFAEIDTNAPFQPFHSDRRVTLSVFDSDLQATQVKAKSSGKAGQRQTISSDDNWVFGDDIPVLKLKIDVLQNPEDEEPESVIYRDTSISTDYAGGAEQIVSTTRKKRSKRGVAAYCGAHQGGEEDAGPQGFFEDDCDVLDFASDRI